MHLMIYHLPINEIRGGWVLPWQYYWIPIYFQRHLLKIASLHQDKGRRIVEQFLEHFEVKWKFPVQRPG